MSERPLAGFEKIRTQPGRYPVVDEGIIAVGLDDGSIPAQAGSIQAIG